MKLFDLSNEIKKILKGKSVSDKEISSDLSGPDGLPLPSKELVFLVTGQYDQNAFYENSLVGISSIKQIVEKNGVQFK